MVTILILCCTLINNIELKLDFAHLKSQIKLQYLSKKCTSQFAINSIFSPHRTALDLCLNQKRKGHVSFGMDGEKGLSGGQEVNLGVHLQHFMLRRLLVKQSSLVDTIIELCVKQSGDPGSVVAVLSPNKKFLYSVFIYAKVSQKQH